MTFNTHPAIVVDVTSGVLLLALGVGVLRLHPRRATNAALAVFSIAFGGAFVAINLFASDAPQHAAGDLAGATLGVVAAGALVALVLLFPHPLSRREGRLAALPGVATVGLAAFSMVASGGLPLTGPSPFSYHILQPAFWFALMLLPLRFAHQEGDSAERVRRQLALMAAALVFYPGFVAGAYLIWHPAPVYLSIGLPGLAAILLSVVGWLRNTMRAGRDARMARNVALLSLALPLVGEFVAATLSPPVAANGPPGVARTLSVAVLAYAILRHQLLGMDIKARWTLSKTSLAGVFVATFFIVSEGAQEFFGEATGSAYVGIVATGLLVFAIAPLSRLADRLAERAIPSTAPEPAPAKRREEVYRKAMRIALRDRQVDRREERHLAELAEHLGIGAARASSLRREVEDAMSRRKPRR